MEFSLQEGQSQKLGNWNSPWVTITVPMSPRHSQWEFSTILVHICSFIIFDNWYFQVSCHFWKAFIISFQDLCHTLCWYFHIEICFTTTAKSLVGNWDRHWGILFYPSLLLILESVTIRLGWWKLKKQSICGRGKYLSLFVPESDGNTFENIGI